MQNNLARMLEGLEANHDSFIGLDHPRWWQYPLEPPTPIPLNVKYACDKTLGSPSIPNCEAALYEFVQSGDVILDPMSGPIIKVTGEYRVLALSCGTALILVQTPGNCAIAVGTNERHSTSWDMLRSVAETLIATCISSHRALGGTAISQTIPSRRRSRYLGRRQTGRISLC